VFATENILRLSGFEKKRGGGMPGKGYLTENKPVLILNFFTRNREKSCTPCPLAKVLQAILAGGMDSSVLYPVNHLIVLEGGQNCWLAGGMGEVELF